MPLHALVVHAAVVFGPLAALGAIVFAVVPRWRWAVRWPSLVVSMTAVGAGVLAWFSGGSYLDAHPALRDLEAVQTHESRADVLLGAIIVFGIVAVAAFLVLPAGPREQSRRFELGSPAGEWAVVAVLVVAAVALLLLVVATGDAGARAVWG